MLSVYPWRLQSIVRLLISVFICVFCGSIFVSATELAASPHPERVAVRFAAVGAGALFFLCGSLIMLRRPWPPEAFRRRLPVLLICFYAGLVLGAWAQSIGGPFPTKGSVSQLVIATLSFQGAAIFLVARFLKEHGLNLSEAFGLRYRWQYAIPIGIIVACVFLPLAIVLQNVSAQLITHVPHLNLKPEEQPAVQTLRVAAAWGDRVVLGIVTILLAPIAEEFLFRGILYPWIKQAGFPRIALWSTSLIFAAIHVNLMAFLPLLVLALALVGLYEKTGNLLACITAHSIFNGLNFAQLYLSDKSIH